MPVEQDRVGVYRCEIVAVDTCVYPEGFDELYTMDMSEYAELSVFEFLENIGRFTSENKNDTVVFLVFTTYDIVLDGKTPLLQQGMKALPAENLKSFRLLL